MYLCVNCIVNECDEGPLCLNIDDINPHLQEDLSALDDGFGAFQSGDNPEEILVQINREEGLLTNAEPCEEFLEISLVSRSEARNFSILLSPVFPGGNTLRFEFWTGGAFREEYEVSYDGFGNRTVVPPLELSVMEDVVINGVTYEEVINVRDPTAEEFGEITDFSFGDKVGVIQINQVSRASLSRLR